MEAAGHPLQALADAITIAEFQTPHRQKLLSWLRIQTFHHKPILQFFCDVVTVRFVIRLQLVGYWSWWPKQNF
jgi:ornithine carbamoyltransferase